MAESATATPAAPVANTPATSSAPTATGDNATPANPSQSQNQSQPNNVNNSNGTSTTQATPSQPNTTTNSNSNSGINNENQPPGSTSDTRANRGLPYYEKLRRDLRDTLQKKRLMDKSMAQLEEQIYRFEQSYLEETTAGNIIKGFDTYIKGSSTGTGSLTGGISLSSSGVGTASRRKAAVTDGDRVFSRSSASFMRDSPAPSSAQTTPSHAPTPSSMYNGSNGKPGNGDTSSAANSVKGGSSSSKNKKKSTGGGGNKGDRDDDDDDKPPSKRLKISYGRD
ncbi:histone acetyltransferase subunit NuA4-domain-containing protein [Aspergillus keveii]|uniref:Chromatin modification-related protein EAF6 n=1 Tax=Aspergillus keveii TaxID=714993 RepID=A0ABR4GPF8_9EURO